MKQYISIKNESPFILRFTKRWYINISIIVLLTFVLSGCYHSADKPLRPSAKFDWQLDSACSRTVSLDIPAGYNEGAVADAIERKLFPKKRASIQCKKYETMLLQTLWPEMSPRNTVNNNEFNVLGGGGTLSILLTSGALDEKDHELDRLDMSLNAIKSVFLSRVCVPRQQPNNTCYELTELAEKETRFDLTSRGVDFSQYENLDKFAYHRYVDILLPVDSNKYKKLFISCVPLEAPLIVRGMKRFPNCNQYFIYKPLNALVKVRYQRQYLSDWKLIMVRVSNLLNSFISKQ